MKSARELANEFKNVKYANIFKVVARVLAEELRPKGLYERISEDTLKCGEYVITVQHGYYAVWKNGTPISFHCDHSRGYEHEMWEGENYNIKRRPVSEDDVVEKALFHVLWTLPHMGHSYTDPDDVREYWSHIYIND